MSAIKKDVTNHCEECGAGYWVKPYRRAKSRFCSFECNGRNTAREHLNTGPKPWAAANLDGHRHKSTSRFQSGHEPWNKDLKGIHLSPSSEWKAGRENRRKLPVGSVTIRHRKRESSPRAFVKVAEPNVWRERAKVVWEDVNGPIPRGKVIHHIDRNPLNDRLENLQAMTRREHAIEHEDELREARNARS